MKSELGVRKEGVILYREWIIQKEMDIGGLEKKRGENRVICRLFKCRIVSLYVSCVRFMIIWFCEVGWVLVLPHPNKNTESTTNSTVLNGKSEWDTQMLTCTTMSFTPLLFTFLWHWWRAAKGALLTIYAHHKHCGPSNDKSNRKFNFMWLSFPK